MKNLISGNWLSTKDGDPAAFQIFKRHYSFHEYRDNRRMTDRRFCGPGKKIVLVTRDYKALFVWRKFIDPSGQKGVNCSIFRNETEILSSDLILEAEQLAWNKWPGQRLYTYVNGKKVHGDGVCFKHAGWKKLNKRTGSGLIVLEKLP